MPIPTEPIGSVPRPAALIAAWADLQSGRISREQFTAIADEALLDTVRRFEATGSPVVTDGEQTKPSFVTYPIAGASNLAPEGVIVPFADGHTRRLPCLRSGPFAYASYASDYLARAKQLTSTPVKQAVISASALSLLYPADGIAGYSRDAFIADVVTGAVRDIRQCLDGGADSVQIDFTEARLSLKLDPSGGLLEQFVALNNQVLSFFSAGEQARIGVHTCPGGDRDSTHSADVDYAGLLPVLMKMQVGRVYVQMASEADQPRVLALLARHRRPDQVIFVGVIDPIDPAVESATQVRDRILRAADHLPIDALGTTDDCGFAPFADDASTSRDVAFAKISARVEGTALAAAALGRA